MHAYRYLVSDLWGGCIARAAVVHPQQEAVVHHPQLLQQSTVMSQLPCQPACNRLHYLSKVGSADIRKPAALSTCRQEA